jgi:hypothetical protein
VAGDWIKMRADLHDDPAVFRLQQTLKVDRFAIVGRLHAFWSWCDKHASNGYVTGAPLTLVDEVVTLNGFADALVLVGWLEMDGDRGLCIPHFERHNGKPAKERALTNQRVRNHRERNADVTEMKRPTVTREEKRREEINTPVAPPESFMRFWQTYPASRRVAKVKCLKFWVSENLDPFAEQVLKHLAAAKETDQWKSDGGKFIPMPYTYLYQRRWEDDMPTGSDPFAGAL